MQAADDGGEVDRVVADAAYILEGEHPCHECGSFVPVFALFPLD